MGLRLACAALATAALVGCGGGRPASLGDWDCTEPVCATPIQVLQAPGGGPGPGALANGVGAGATDGGAAAQGGPGAIAGPVCPASQPTEGAPCDPTANSLPCTYARRTCFCGGAWSCL